MAAPAVYGEEEQATPEMIEAGLRALYGSHAIENPVEGADRLVVEEIYKAMREERRRTKSPTSSVPA